MRNLKKLLAVVVAICVLATFTVPAFADTKTDAQIATDLGVIKGAGSGVTADYLATTPDRLQGAILFLRLKGLEDTAKAFVGTDNFADVEGLSDTNQAILAYLKANPDLGYAGVGENKFSPLTKMSAKEYYKVMLVALGYTYETDFTWANVFGFAASKGLTKLIDNTTFTVNDLAIGTVEALKTPVKGGTDTLISKLVDGGSITSAVAVAAGIGYSATPKALTVVSATADTLQVATIVFSKELDSTTVNSSNITNSNIVTDGVRLGADKKTVFVKVSKQDQDKSLDFTIENVKDTTGLAITKVVKSISFRDVTIPVVTGAVAKNPKTLVISTSEPMNFDYPSYQALNSIKIDGAVAFGKAVSDFSKNTITVTLNTAMTAGTHKISLADIADYAGYKAVATEYNIDVAADTTAPSIISAVYKTINTIEVTFNEELSEKGTFYVGTTNTTEVLGKDFVSGDTSKVLLTLNGDLDIGATVGLTIEYKGQKDAMGNEVTTKTSYTGLKVADDTALPTVTAAIAAGNTITLTFSKPMYVAGTIKVVKASDATSVLATKTITAASDFKSGTNQTVIELKKNAYTTGNLDSKTPTDVKVNITSMKDSSVRKNILTEQNLPLTLLDTTAPVVATYYTVTQNATDSTKDTVTFSFGEAMNPDSIKSLSNYILGEGLTTGGAFASFSSISLKEVSSDNTKVTFTVPGIATAGQTFYGAVVTVYAVTDTATNMAARSVVTNKALGSAPTFAIKDGSAIATGKRAVTVEFTDKVGKIDYTAFEITNGTDKHFFGGSGSLDATATKATIDLYEDLPASTTGYTVKFTNNIGNIKDIYGTVISGTAGSNVSANAAVADKIKPTATVDAGTTAGSITISFDETVNAGTFIAAGATTISGLQNQVLLWKNGTTTVDLTTNAATTVSFLKAGALVTTGGDFDKIVITGLEKGISYSVTILDGIIKDASTNLVNVLNNASKTTNN